MNREESARHVLRVSDALGRWWARDFKPGQSLADLTSTQYAILSLAQELDGPNLSRLADHLDLSVPTVLRAVAALQRKGLVKRHRTSMRQRDIRVSATPEGRELQERFEHAREERLADLFSWLSDEEIAALVRGYDAMTRAVSRMDAESDQASDAV